VLENFARHPALLLVPFATVLTVLLIPLLLDNDRLHAAFIATAASIVGQLATVGIGLFPNVVPALGEPARSLTIATASSSSKTLLVMFIVAVLGMPLVVAYTAWAYRTFRGRVTPEDYVY